MAVLKDKKRDYYALKQKLRDEAGAPEHLDTAGDLMIKELARKQTDKATSLGEQLQIRQEFEKGSELKPWTQSGLTTLEKFRETSGSGDGEASTSKKSVDYDLEAIKARSGLSRHELELGLAEKPGSRTSALYRFAIGNRKAKTEKDDLVSKLDRHPLNRLREIEDEVFGKKENEEEEGEGERSKKRRRKRKRRKRIENRKEMEPTDGEKEEEGKRESSEEEDVTSHRPSLWDVKDMGKFCRNEQQGCQIQKLFTIREGKIVEVNPQEES